MCCLLLSRHRNLLQILLNLIRVGNAALRVRVLVLRVVLEYIVDSLEAILLK